MRKRWTDEKRLQRQQADWIVGYIRKHGPLTTHDLIEAMKAEEKTAEAHILNRALRKSPFITSNIISKNGKETFVWKFEV
ncbi:MAG: hypothetical protein CBC77_000790 [Euryarchaeota archaeon TMED117]|nr:MAG: hypothetical protein CBC77_000790 [Euryarchaeota archaeon TMED117]|tara:strand:+ start:41 stop:280 length:240 start_codon:yes stop_codon:yes gene_type:complete